jgi:hypothetical protein
MNCTKCGGPSERACRIRNGRADYFCASCMDAELDAYGFVEGDTWVAVSAELTTEHLE